MGGVRSGCGDVRGHTGPVVLGGYCRDDVSLQNAACRGVNEGGKRGSPPCFVSLRARWPRLQTGAVSGYTI